MGLSLCVYKFENRVRSGIEQGAIQAGEAEQTYGEVLGQQLVQADDAEGLDHADLVLGEVSEEDGGVASTDPGHIIVDDVALAKEGGRETYAGAVLPDEPAIVILDLGKGKEGVAIEHELAVLGVGAVHSGDQVEDVVEGDGGGSRFLRSSGRCGDQSLRLAGACSGGEVLIGSASEALHEQV